LNLCGVFVVFASYGIVHSNKELNALLDKEKSKRVEKVVIIES
jgi:hypothetical protein